jgi:hypothetical protein
VKSSNVDRDAEIWIAPNISGSVTSITINLGGSTSGSYTNVSEWSGLNTSGTLDGTNSNNNTVNTITTGSVTTTNAADLLIACTREGGPTPTFSSGPTNSWTALNSNNTALFDAAYLIQSSTGTQSTGWTITSSAPAWDAVIGAIKGVGSPGIPGQFPRTAEGALSRLDRTEGK